MSITSDLVQVNGGGFAFLDFDDTEGAHPLTISLAWTGDGNLAFSIKGLGDYRSSRRLCTRNGNIDSIAIENKG